MRLKRYFKKSLSMFLVSSMVVTSMPIGPAKQVNAEQIEIAGMMVEQTTTYDDLDDDTDGDSIQIDKPISEMSNAEKKQVFDSYPDQAYFPISVLDFNGDNLLFEHPYGRDLELFDSGKKIGTGLVESTLGDDGLPVYKQATVERIAKAVLDVLKNGVPTNNVWQAPHTDAIEKPYVDGKLNPISMRNYIIDSSIDVLCAKDAELTGGAAIQDSINCLKQQYVENIGGQEQGTVSFEYNCERAGTYELRIYAMTASTDPRKFQIRVNGGTAVQTNNISCAASKKGDDAYKAPDQTPYTMNITLQQGKNTIVFSGVGTNPAPNLDRIEIGSQTVASVNFRVEAESCTLRNSSGLSIKSWNTYSNGQYIEVTSNPRGYTNTFQAPRAGNYTVTVGGYKKNGAGTVGISINGTVYNTYVQNYAGQFQFNAPLQAGTNTLIISSGSSIDIDYFDFYSEGSTTQNQGYPLGTYAESKAKYDVDSDGDGISDMGWFDIRTCTDYAYFVTKNLFKYHPTLNKAYGAYRNMIFKKVGTSVEDAAYVFVADKNHKAENEGLIYNPTNGSIRNGGKADVNTQNNEFYANPGNIFVCDTAPKMFPSYDPYIDDVSNNNNTVYKQFTESLDQVTDKSRNYHNFHYTIQSHSSFVYKEGYKQKFIFAGDDDVYIFVNKKLVADLGGADYSDTFSVAGNAETTTIMLEDHAKEWGLESGKMVQFDFFYMDRHGKASNFYAKMNLSLKTDEVVFDWSNKDMDNVGTLEEKDIPYGYLVDLNYNFKCKRELVSNKNFTFTDGLGNVIGADGFKLAEGVSFKTLDEKKEDGTIEFVQQPLTVTVIRAKSNTESKKRETQVTMFREDQEAAIQEFFKNLTLRKGDSIKVEGLVYDSGYKEYEDYNIIAGENADSKRQFVLDINAHYDSYMDMGTSNANAVAIPTDMPAFLKVNLLVDDLVVSIEMGSAIKDWSGYGQFTLKRDADGYKLEQLIHENQVNIMQGGEELIFHALPRGTYTLALTLDQLVGYDYSVDIIVGDEKMTVNQGEVLEITKQRVINGELKNVTRRYSFNGLKIDLEPEIQYSDEKGWHWEYPDVRFVLNAKRVLNTLKDLT